MDHGPIKIVPGAVDAHVHLKDAAGLSVAAGAGIAALRDAGTKDGAGLKISGPGRPQVVSAGWALIRKRGYGSFMGTAVEGRAEVRAEILKLRSAGAGIIKVVASGMVSLKDPGTITPGGFGREELRTIVEEAGAAGLGVMAHANGEDAIGNAAAAGVRSIEHGFFMTTAALEALYAGGVYWVPTVGALMRAADQANVPAEAKAFIKTTVDGHLAMIRSAFERGVRLAIGTDCTLPDLNYRAVYEAELSYFQKAGIPAADVDMIARDGGSKLLQLL